MRRKDYIRISNLLRQKLKAKAPGLQPDFIFQKKKLTEIALAESKGSFVNPLLDNPRVKGDLSYGLKQLRTWSAFLKPVVKKTYAIGTYFRDDGDLADPSLIAFVDPPGEDDPNLPSFDLPDDWIRRGNYGNWLMGMGRDLAGDAIRSGEVAELQPANYLKVKFGGREIAVVPFAIQVTDGRNPMNRFYWELNLLARSLGTADFPAAVYASIGKRWSKHNSSTRFMSVGLDTSYVCRARYFDFADSGESCSTTRFDFKRFAIHRTVYIRWCRRSVRQLVVRRIIFRRRKHGGVEQCGNGRLWNMNFRKMPMDVALPLAAIIAESAIEKPIRHA